MITYEYAKNPKVYSKQYKSFKGVDFSTGVTEVDDSRSPYAVNVIADMAGFPEKCPGYKSVLDEVFSDGINGVFPYTYSGTDYFMVHTGTNLYRCTLAEEITVKTLVYSSMADSLSSYFVMNGKFYIMDGAKIIRYDGSSAVLLESVAYVPTTTIAAPPAGGGEAFESVNLLEAQRKNKFAGTSGDTEYFLDTQDIDSVDKIELLQSNGTWSETTAYTASTSLGKITFTSAPGVSPVTGEDNIRVTFTKAVSGYADMIKKCTISVFYGLGSDIRVFLSGNPDYQNRDWKSGLNQPEYFPDDDYSIVGTEDSAIMGYLKQYEALIIVKEETNVDATMYLRTSSTADDGTVTYPVQQGLAGVGAISKRAFGMPADDPLLFSKNGVYGIESNNINYKRNTQLRSFYVNTNLIKESNLSLAHAAVWGRFYCLFVNDKVYVANTNQTNSNSAGGTGYEWYLWDDTPASCSVEFDGDLYFGTLDGDICKFTTYDDYGNAAYYRNDESYTCRWSTKMDDFGDFMQLKTILRRGVGILAKPYVKSSGTIYYVTDKEYKLPAAEFSDALNSFDFGSLDFSDFTFNAVENPRVVPANKKYKNAQLLQIVVENSVGGEGFGMYGIQVRYMFTKDVK